MFITERIVEFGMCDSAGILFFAKIFELSHSAYEEFVLRSELEENYFENEIFAIPLINAAANFIEPIKLHEILEINVSVTKIGSTSFELTHSFLNEDGKTKAITKTTHIFVNKYNFTKTEIPVEFLSLLKENEN